MYQQFRVQTYRVMGISADSSKNPTFSGRMEPRALARVTLVATALPTGATGFLGKHILVIALTRAFRRAAAKPTTRTAAHTMPDRLHNT